MFKFLLFSLAALSISSMAQVNLIDQKCGEPPSLLLLNHKDGELKKAKSFFVKYNKCVSSLGVKDEGAFVNPEVYIKEKESLDFCEKMLPVVFKESYESKTYSLTNITKKNPNTKELNQMVLQRVEEKKDLCQSHLDGKFDDEIYSKKMKELKACFATMKDTKDGEKIFDQFKKISWFIENRAQKKMLKSQKSSDLLNVQRNLEDCSRNLSEVVSSDSKVINQDFRGRQKMIQLENVSPKNNASENTFKK